MRGCATVVVIFEYVICCLLRLFVMQTCAVVARIGLKFNCLSYNPILLSDTPPNSLSRHRPLCHAAADEPPEEGMSCDFHEEYISYLVVWL